MAIALTKEEWVVELTRGAEELGLTLVIDDYGAEATRARLRNEAKTWTWTDQEWMDVAIRVYDALSLYAAGKGVETPNMRMQHGISGPSL